MQELISQLRLHRLSRVHPCLLFIIALLHLAGSRTREKQPCSFSFLMCSCAIMNSGEHQPVRLGFCISDMLSADYHSINPNVKDSWFNSEFSNSYRTKTQRVSILKKSGGEKQSHAAVAGIWKNASLKLFFFSWSTFCMTHEPGSKMASKRACIILHIQVSAYAVLRNIPRRAGFAAGAEQGRGKGAHPQQGPNLCQHRFPDGLTQPSMCSGQPPASVQPAPLHRFLLGSLAWKMCLFLGFCFGVVFCLLGFFWYSRKMGAFWVYSKNLLRKGGLRESQALEKVTLEALEMRPWAPLGCWHCFFCFLPIWQWILPPLLVESTNK